MSYIEETQRPLARKLKTFVDGYEWWIDDPISETPNHRLTHPPTDQASVWSAYNSIATLHDRFILTKFWQGVMPIEIVMLWQTTRTID